MNRPVAAVIEQASAIQRRAADAEASVWVDASAGTGKTTVLTNRVLSLLLNGTPPARILCLTFTKAAAAEMANRIAARLQEWSAMPEDELHRSLLALTNAQPSEDRRRTARRLFARVLDTPGGMKIQTIHAFCQSLLKRFPLEAGIAPHFDVLDERGGAELLVVAREEVINRARGGTAQTLAAALAEVTRLVGEGEFDDLMRALSAERARLAKLLTRFGDIEALVRAIYPRLAVAVGDTADRICRAGCEDEKLDLLVLRQAAKALADSAAKTDRERGAAILRWLASDVETRAAEFDDYCGQYLTDDEKIRKRLITDGAAAANPGVDEILLAEAMRVVNLRDRCKAATIAGATAALLRLGAEMLASYDRHKKSRSLLDYEDLVLATRDLLLRGEGVAPWVLFKLDGGLDHILIDEAQDTNPEQWEIVATLADEFFAGEGARAEVRTVFAVGDPKQSIFSFQRADPASFARMRQHFKRRVDDARAQWNEIPLTISFRSTAAVLDAVNAIFARPEAQDGLFIGGAWPLHEPSRVGQAGLVELWPPAMPLEPAAPEPWALPTERRAGDSPRGRLARLIASRIAAMIESGERLESRGRAVQAGDFLVLVRRRDALVEELVRELKQRDVRVAGVDRMVLTEQLAVMDLVALGQFLLLPEDDLTLATVLKSPFVGFSEDDLYALAQPRAGGLWNELKERRGESLAFAAAHATLSDLLAQADYVPPYELYADLLGRRGGRQALLARLGPDAADPIDEFLNLTLAYERNHVPSLQGFLQWLGGGAVEIKRDLDQDIGGQVRIMTVHGAKGLQAPIVFLPDTMQTPRQAARLLWIDDKAGGTLPLWSPRIGFDDTRTGGAREGRQSLDVQEQNRLLYVALTRAEDRLYVCGWHGRQTPPAGCWYHRIADGFATLGESFAFDSRAELGAQGWAGTGRRLGTPQSAPPQSEDRARAGMQAVPTNLPPWYRAAARPDGPGTRPLTPSRPAGAEPPVRTPIGPDDRLRFRRGLVIHRLLELLPELPRERRAEACRRFLARPIHELDAAGQEEIAGETLRVLDDPVFAPLFGPGSRAEVRVAGEVAGVHGTMVLSGQVDRLVVTATEVLVLDYKTNRPPPATEGDVAEIYLRQMAAYRAVLRRIYADRPVTCALLWTDGPRLMPLSLWLLDRYSP